MSFAVRDAVPADFGRIAEIYAHHVTTGFGTFEEAPPSRDEMLARFVHIASLGLPYLVAEGDGSVLGYAYAGPYRPRSAYRFTVEDSVYVAPDAQHRGIGAALLGGVIERSAAAGMKQMVAVIGDSANRASIRVHTKCGFTQIGTLLHVGFKANRWVDTVMMQRTL